MINLEHVCPKCGKKDFPNFMDDNDVEYCICGYWRRIYNGNKQRIRTVS